MKTLRNLLMLLAAPYVMAHVCKPDHSCYTQTLTTANIGTACPPLTTCGPHADCILLSTLTISAPPTDTCCPTTATSLVPGPCPTCQQGCDIDTRTVFVTAGSKPTSTQSEPTISPILSLTLYKDSLESSTSSACTTTLLRDAPFTLGPTSTAYTATVVETQILECGRGCVLVTRDLGGIGPVAIFTTTVTASAPATSTTFVCGFQGL